tara:strand:+ start:5643 stop:5942 length:300 start_codon:yes stop_codon:yes gene_type:complete
MKNTPLTIVAKIFAKEGKRAVVKSELIKLIAATKAEKGCITYDLHQDNEDLNVFLFFENWESRALWQEHMKNSHIAAFQKATEGIVKSVVLNEMTQIEN